MKKEITKQMLAESLLYLGSKQSVEKVTICEIVKHCHTGRQTFYNHFRNKYELIYWIYTTHTNDIIQKYRGRYPWGVVLGYTLEYMMKHYRFFGNVMKEEGPESFYIFLTQYTQADYIDFIQSRYGTSVLTNDLLFAIKFNSYGATNMAKEWLEAGAVSPTQELGIRIANSMSSEIRPYFDGYL